MKVVICDYDFKDVDPERKVFESLPEVELIPCQCKTEEEVIELTKDAVGVINQWSQLNANVISHMKNCKVISTYGIGTDKIDLEAASEKGILVCNVPDYGTNEVGDHTIAMILNCIRRISQFDKMVRKGDWKKYTSYPIRRVQGQTLGLLGLGKIPRNIAKKMQSAFGMNVMAYDPYVDAETMKTLDVEKATLEEVFSRADIVSVHIPLTNETRYLVDKKLISLMKKEAYLVNCGRGAIVNEQDLYEALVSEKIAGAALDVFEVEPVDMDNPLLSLDNVVVTPHSAYYAEESILALQTGAAEVVRRVLAGEEPINVVNKQILIK